MSVTALIDSERNKDLYQNYKPYLAKDRVHGFEAEEFYLRKNMMPLHVKRGISTTEFNQQILKLNQSSQLFNNKLSRVSGDL